MINNFWDWFSRNCQDFGSHFENTSLLKELDIWVSKLGNYSWEVGPGKIEENALVISPNGDFKLLKETKIIVENAKKCTGWEYYYAKPPKEWNLVFDFEATNGDQMVVNASNWRYVLINYDDGFEIVIKSRQLTLLNDEDKLAVAEITLIESWERK